jgi:hypothetical protein
MAKHPGFKKASASISKREGFDKETANAILASASREASPAAKKKNPRLKKVGMPHAKSDMRAS